jgi:prepilin-type processing-associated H-X9-DG protein
MRKDSVKKALMTCEVLRRLSGQGAVRSGCGARPRRNPCAFTLIEVLVVASLIVMLMAILVPSLTRARKRTRSVVCIANLRAIGQATAEYLHDNDRAYPPAYVFPIDEHGSWSTEEQSEDAEHGVIHWSRFILPDETTDPTLFQCPDFENGGAPRTNPGLSLEDWESGQVDGTGNSTPKTLVDNQPPRMAYAANAAVISPNRFERYMSDGPRVNMTVKEHLIRSPGKVILATEYINDWRALARDVGEGFVSLSHRPIDPFAHIESGFDEYGSSTKSEGFIYGTISDQDTYGLLPARDMRGRTNLLAVDPGVSGINAVGRAHPTSDRDYDDEFGGGANFLYCDAHAEVLPILHTLRSRQWGERYYTISGKNKIVQPPGDRAKD